MRQLSAVLAAVFLSLAATAANKAQTKVMNNTNPNSSAKPDFKLPPVPVEQFTLKNGLRVVLSKDDAIPVVAVCVYYDVGSRNEKQGRTGFAHLFEHMMFQGSENVPKAGHFKHISNNGGEMNGNTSSEKTRYFEILPASQLPLALWLESDRMRSLKITKDNLENQRSAVKEEKRLNFDNRAYGNVFNQLNEQVFSNFANSHSVIGSMADLDAATLADVQEFFRIYYAPNNAVLTIAGSFDSQEAHALVEKYFASIPSQPLPAKVDVTEPVTVAAKHGTYSDNFAPLPGFLMAWKVPARRQPDRYALEVASGLLYEGASSRLYQKLVKGNESVLQIFGTLDERRGPSLMFIGAIPKPGFEPAAIRATMVAEIKLLATEGPTPAELEKVRNQIRNQIVRSLQSSLARAQTLAEYTLYDGDPTLINTEVEQYLKVSADDVKRSVAKYLLTENQSLLEIEPAKPATAPGPAGAPTNP